jgi:molybdopterin/thiamine biosynthesis adenylyltransferase
MTYLDYFERNYGVFTPEQQERIRNARVAVIGCGGIGGVLAVVLARSGVEHFVLMDHDVYKTSNMNRQVICFCDTLGKNKALCVQEDILRINPQAEIEVHQRALAAEDLQDLANWGDVIAPVMDEWPLSLSALEAVRKKGKPAIMAYPVGALGRVCVFTADSLSVAECLAMPYGFDYAQLKEYTSRPEARRLLQYYVTEGEWTEEWFDRWTEGRAPHAQLAPIVWMTACLAAQEVIKLVSGRWKPVVAPHYWHVTPHDARVKRFGHGRQLISRLSRRERVQQYFPRLTASKPLLRWFTRLLG